MSVNNLSVNNLPTEDDKKNSNIKINSILPRVPTPIKLESNGFELNNEINNTRANSGLVTERKGILERIKCAYRKKANSYEELLEVCCAVEEDLLFTYAPSRLDYIKSGVQCLKRIGEKKHQLEQNAVAALTSVGTPIVTTEETPTTRMVKRAKTGH